MDVSVNEAVMELSENKSIDVSVNEAVMELSEKKVWMFQ